MNLSAQPRISVSRQEILAFLGQPQSLRLIQIANGVARDAQALISPIYHISDSFEKLSSSGKGSLSDLGNERCFVGAVTIGAKLEQEASHLFRSGLICHGLTLDAFGTLATRKTVMEALKAIKDIAAAADLFPGELVIPGIGGERLETHKTILQAFGNQKDISVSEKLLLRPLKSSTFYISLSHISEDHYNACFSKNCSHFNPQCSKCDIITPREQYAT